MTISLYEILSLLLLTFGTSIQLFVLILTITRKKK